MFDLTRRWPFGLNSKTWPDRLAALVLVLFVLLFFDVWISQTLQEWPDIWRQPFAFVTGFGLSDWILIPSLIVLVLSAVTTLLLRPGLYRRAAHELTLLSGFIFAGVGGPGLATNLLKRLFGRGRPSEFADYGGFSFEHVFNGWNFQSFPSGHSTTAIAFAFVVGFLAPRYFRLVVLISLMTGISRVVVGMHYPTDVVAGFCVGMVGAYAVRNLFAARRWLFVKTRDEGLRFRGLPNLRRTLRRLRQRA